jgi:hypothetical protein
MKNGCCCNDRSDAVVAGKSKVGAVRRAMSWIVPGIVLAMMPKCPLCLVSYIALFTGIGISFAAANFAWWSVVVGCVAVLAYLATTTVRGFVK